MKILKLSRVNSMGKNDMYKLCERDIYVFLDKVLRIYANEYGITSIVDITNNIIYVSNSIESILNILVTDKVTSENIEYGK